MTGFSPLPPPPTIRQRLALGNIVISLLLLLTGGIALWQINRLSAAAQALQVARKRATVALEIHQHSTQLIAIASRLLLIEEATVFEAEVTRTLKALRESHDVLETLIAEAKVDEAAYSPMNRVHNRIDSVIGVAETMVRQASAGQWHNVHIRVGVLTRDQQQLAREMNTLVEIAKEMEEAAASQVASTRRAAMLYSLLIVLLSIVLGTLLTLQTTRSIVRPIEQLTQGATHLADGFLDKRVSVESADELGQLAAAFNQMAERLQASHAELEQRVAERTVELARERNMLNATLDALPDLLFEVDRQGRIHDFRAPQPETLYRPPEEFLDKTVDQVLPPNAASAVLDGLRRAAETGRYTGGLYSLDTPRGTGWFEFSIAVRGDSQAPEVRFIALARDVTAQVRAEEALKRRNRELTTLYEATTAISSNLSLDVVLQAVTQQMVHLLDSSGCTLSLWDRERNLTETLVDYNQQLFNKMELPGTIYNLSGYPATRQVLEAGQAMVVQRDDPTVDEAELALMEEWGISTVLMLPLIAHDRVVGLMELYDKVERHEYSPEQIRLAESLAAQAAIAIENAQLYEQAQQEIAERVRAEDRLQQRNNELALLNRLSQQLTATLDPQQVIEQLIKAGAQIIGSEGASVWLWDKERGEGLVCQSFFHHGQKHSALNLRLEPGQGVVGWVAQTGESAIVPYAPDDPRFFPGIDKLTGLCTISLLGVPLWARDEVIGVMEMVNKQEDDFDQDDLTLAEMLAASAAIALDNAGLVERLRQYTAELEARNEELDAYAHTVAHDLKNPLSLILGFTRVLLEDYATMPREEMRSHLEAVARSGQKMHNIIDELLLLAGVRTKEVQIEPLDMASIVAEALQRLAYMIGEHQAEVILPNTWPKASGYGPWVEEVWANYISNAIRYGGRPPRVELGFDELASRRVSELVSQRVSESSLNRSLAHSRIRFWVRDNGIGLTTEEQARLFTPFTSLAKLDCVSAKGHGLGLSIVRRIVEKLGGQVGVESEVGIGSTFWFSLPE